MSLVLQLATLTLFGLAGSNGFAAGMVALHQITGTVSEKRSRAWASCALTAGFSTVALVALAVVTEAAAGTPLVPLMLGSGAIAVLFGVSAMPLALFVARRLNREPPVSEVFELRLLSSPHIKGA